MTDKELRKMGRAELLQMLITERTENESLAMRLNASATELLEVQNQLAAVTEELETERAKNEKLNDEIDDTRIMMLSAQEELQETQAAMETLRKESAEAMETLRTGSAEAMDALRKETDEKIAEMQAKVDDAESRLQKDIIRMNEAGNIAEASLKVQGVFDAAQAAAEQYLSSIRELKDRQESISAKALAESKAAAERLLAETRNVCNTKRSQTEEKCAAMERETTERCQSMVETAKREADAYWASLSGRMTDFYDAHQGMRELLNFFDMKMPEPGKKPEDLV